MAHVHHAYEIDMVRVVESSERSIMALEATGTFHVTDIHDVIGLAAVAIGCLQMGFKMPNPVIGALLEMCAANLERARGGEPSTPDAVEIPDRAIAGLADDDATRH